MIGNLTNVSRQMQSFKLKISDTNLFSFLSMFPKFVYQIPEDKDTHELVQKQNIFCRV